MRTIPYREELVDFMFKRINSMTRTSSALFQLKADMMQEEYNNQAHDDGLQYDDEDLLPPITRVERLELLRRFSNNFGHLKEVWTIAVSNIAVNTRNLFEFNLLLLAMTANSLGLLDLDEDTEMQKYIGHAFRNGSVSSRRYFSRVDFTNEYLSGYILQGLALQKSLFRNTTMANMMIEDCNLREAEFIFTNDRVTAGPHAGRLICEGLVYSVAIDGVSTKTILQLVTLGAIARMQQYEPLVAKENYLFDYDPERHYVGTKPKNLEISSNTFHSFFCQGCKKLKSLWLPDGVRMRDHNLYCLACSGQLFGEDVSPISSASPEEDAEDLRFVDVIKTSR